MARTFELGGRKFNYARRKPFWYKTERVVECSLMLTFLQEHAGQQILGSGKAPSKILEVGNVSYHWCRNPHPMHKVIDLNEVPRPEQKKYGYENADVLEWTPTERYDAVMSISTLEHVIPNQSKAVRRVLSWADDALITMPFGYPVSGPAVRSDHLLDEDWDADIYFLKRMSAEQNYWQQISRAEVSAASMEERCYGKRTPFAGYLMVFLKGGMSHVAAPI